MNLDRSTFLFAQPSAANGFARVMDLSGSLNEYNQSMTPKNADEIALRMDMAAVVNDLWEAIDETLDNVAEHER